MDFELNEEQSAYAEMARIFSKNELAPKAQEWDEKQIFPIKTILKAGELGMCGLYSPEEQGG